MEQRLLKEGDAAIFLGVSRIFLRRGRSEGQRQNRAAPPPFIRAGRMIRYDLTDLERWIETHRQDVKAL
jgi:hypothetical protein